MGLANSRYPYSHGIPESLDLIVSANRENSLAAELLSRMPEKQPTDISKKLVSPMPGLLVSLEVNKGDSVKSGDALAVVEAMKMENQLFAQSDGVVTKIFFSPGDSLDVGQIILELE
mgnify:CR=1 FL=1